MLLFSNTILILLSELDSEAKVFYSSLNYCLVSPWTMDGHEFAYEQIIYIELMKIKEVTHYDT